VLDPDEDLDELEDLDVSGENQFVTPVALEMDVYFVEAGRDEDSGVPLAWGCVQSSDGEFVPVDGPYPIQ
jgi:hypothetical protein